MGNYTLRAEWTSGGVPITPIVMTQEEGQSIEEFEAAFEARVAAVKVTHPPDPPA